MKHPDYDIEFKPAIARYDWDQTYDVLEFVHLPQGFSELMAMVGIPCYELMAIDRFTPYRYLWAEGYSDYVYNFLKPFNYSPNNSVLERWLTDEDGRKVYNEPFTHAVWNISGNPFGNSDNLRPWLGRHQAGEIIEHNGKVWRNISNGWSTEGVEPQNEPTVWRDITPIIIPSFTHSNRYDPTAEYTLQLSEGDYCVTFLVEQGIQDGLTNGIITINQVCRYFSVHDTTEIDLNKIINGVCQDNYPLYSYHAETGEEVSPQHPQAVVTLNEASRFCANSLVLSKKVNGTWQQLTITSSDNFLFYADISDYFTEVSDALMQYFDDVVYEGFVNCYTRWYAIGAGGWANPTYYDGLFDCRISKESGLHGYVSSFSVSPSDIVGTYSSQIVSVTYDVFPQYMIDTCYLARANNNKWGGNLYPDLGNVFHDTSINIKQRQLGSTEYYRSGGTKFYSGDTVPPTLNDDDTISLNFPDYSYDYGYYGIDYPPLQPILEQMAVALTDTNSSNNPLSPMKGWGVFSALFLGRNNNSFQYPLWANSQQQFSLYSSNHSTQLATRTWLQARGSNVGDFSYITRSVIPFSKGYAKKAVIPFYSPIFYVDANEAIYRNLLLTGTIDLGYIDNVTQNISYSTIPYSYDAYEFEPDYILTNSLILWDETEWQQFNALPMSEQDYLTYLQNLKAQQEAQ